MQTASKMIIIILLACFLLVPLFTEIPPISSAADQEEWIDPDEWVDTPDCDEWGVLFNTSVCVSSGAETGDIYYDEEVNISSYTFEPRPDITEYELALMIPVWIAVAKDYPAYHIIEGLPPEARRHFIKN